MTLPPIVVDELGVWIVLLVVVGSEDDIMLFWGRLALYGWYNLYVGDYYLTLTILEYNLW